MDTELNSEAQHVADLGLCDAADAELWSYVSAHDSILISKDEDFAYMFYKSLQPS